ncbi:MAG: hypothetical protein V4678_02880 [Patescibacteria group bacterium]
MSVFHHSSLAFQPIDPMADGLGDDIAVEQNEVGHFELTEQLDGRLAQDWEEILSDARKDPDFTFVSED